MISDLFAYLIQSSLSLAILYTVYWLFLKNDTFFSANRVFLLGSVLVSCLLPLISIPIFSEDPEATYAVMLESITITANQIESDISHSLSLNQRLLMIYFTGVSIFFIRLLFQVFQLTYLINRFGVVHKAGLKLVNINSKYSPFSYFNYVFVNDKVLQDDNLESILEHERIHIQQKHSIDLIILETLTVIQWFNPFVWLYKSSLKGIHEYLADEGILAQGTNKMFYQNVLLNHAIGLQINDLTNNFNQSLIKKRFIMMTKNQSGRAARMKLLLFIPVFSVLAICFACNSQESTNHELQTEKAKAENLKKSTDDLFTVVEVMPQFKGGEQALYAYLGQSIKYPAKAQKEGIEGRVYLRFVIEKDGSISNAEILRGVSPEIDAEALRVVSEMPVWIPGKQREQDVRVQYNLPIKFSLQ